MSRQLRVGSAPASWMCPRILSRPRGRGLRRTAPPRARKTTATGENRCGSAGSGDPQRSKATRGNWSALRAAHRGPSRPTRLTTLAPGAPAPCRACSPGTPRGAGVLRRHQRRFSRAHALLFQMCRRPPPQAGAAGLGMPPTTESRLGRVVVNAAVNDPRRAWTVSCEARHASSERAGSHLPRFDSSGGWKQTNRGGYF